MSDESSSLLPDSTLHPSRSSYTSPERQPLLSLGDNKRRYVSRFHEEDSGVLSSTTTNTLSSHAATTPPSEKSKSRWTSLVFILITTLIIIVIFFFVSIAPSSIETYARQALSVEPTKISIDSFTDNGIKVRIKADFKVDAARVAERHLRFLGKSAFWLARTIESQQTDLNFILPDYKEKPIAKAKVPKLVVDVRNFRTTSLDFIVVLIFEDTDIIRKISNQWLEGGLDRIRILVSAEVGLKSGLIALGSQPISNLIVIEGVDIPVIPSYHVSSIKVEEIPGLGNEMHILAASISVFIKNVYPIEFDLPALEFKVLAQGCNNSLIELTRAFIQPAHFKPRSGVTVKLRANFRELPKTILEPCSKSNSSPLDMLLTNYAHGKNITMFIQELTSSGFQKLKWVTDIMSNMTLPVSVPSHQFNSLIRNFTLTDTQFKLPDVFAEPGNDEGNPHLSGRIRAIVDIPREMNLNISVNRFRATVKTLYKEQIFGTISIHRWQTAKSEQFQRPNDGGLSIRVKSFVDNAPLKITDENIFADIVQALLINGGNVLLQVEALLDIELFTILGQFVIHDIPAEGNVPIKV